MITIAAPTSRIPGPPHAGKSRNATDAAGGGLSRCQTKEVRFSAGDLFHGKEEP